MRFPRASGILLHPTSLPGRFGIGDLGPAAYRFLDWLAAAGQHWWQVLPLGPTGYGDSPYQCFSAFAGNPLLISPELLLADGLLSQEEVRSAPDFPAAAVDYGAVIAWKQQMLSRVAPRVQQDTVLARELDELRRQNAWLDEYALFMALKDEHREVVWNRWPRELATRQPHALRQWRERLAARIDVHSVAQLLFFRQWQAVRRHAQQLGVRIIGDIPIFVAYDSADVWARPELFHLDAQGAPAVVAGVPPDYFSETGQLWGNPLYRWETLAQRGYDWWIERFRATLSQVDVVRIDHFIGFTRYWEIPAGEPTAIRGRYLPGPGAPFLEAVRNALGGLPLIAEDLGVLTPEVEALRDRFDLPGMKILQFAFGADPSDRFLPHNYLPNCVVYTGTHDNDTTHGWFHSCPAGERSTAQRYLGRHGDDIAWDLIRLGMMSVADTFIAPLQDVLSLGTAARMNFPGKPSGNWRWRFEDGQLGEHPLNRLREMTEVYARVQPASTFEPDPMATI